MPIAKAALLLRILYLELLLSQAVDVQAVIYHLFCRTLLASARMVCLPINQALASNAIRCAKLVLVHLQATVTPVL
jgi:hypothetical protein